MGNLIQLDAGAVLEAIARMMTDAAELLSVARGYRLTPDNVAFLDVALSLFHMFGEYCKVLTASSLLWCVYARLWVV